MSNSMHKELHEHYFRSTMFLFEGRTEMVGIFRAMSQFHGDLGYITKQSLTHPEIGFFCDKYALHIKDRFAMPEGSGDHGSHTCRSYATSGISAMLQQELE